MTLRRKSRMVSLVRRPIAWVGAAGLALIGGTWAAAGALSGLDVLNALSGAPSVRPVTLAYGDSPRQQVDIYPQQERGRPILVWFYGGAWSSGSRTDYRFVARTFHDLGYVVAIPDYRLTPEVVYPDFLRDSAAAVRLVIDEAVRFGGDPSRVLLAGHSAGAYNAAMLALDDRWLPRTYRKRVKGVIGLAAPVNFLPIQMPEARLAFSWPDTPRDSQPIEHVTRESPPMLLISAKTDPLVDPDINSAVLAGRLRSVGVRVDEERFGDPIGLITHARLVATLSETFSPLVPTIERIDNFARQVAR